MWSTGESFSFRRFSCALAGGFPSAGVVVPKPKSVRKTHCPLTVKTNSNKNSFLSSRTRVIAGSLALMSSLSMAALAAGPQVVSGPGVDADCLKPWSSDTKYFKWPKKDGPYRVALVNGFIGNTWRIQMIKTAKAYAEKPDVKSQLKEFKVVSTGEDLAAQIAAANNFIDSGYDAVIVNALNPAAFAPVVKRANAAGVVLLSFDNVIESRDAITVNDW
jgi:ribose transport system substrate-binding protein